MIKTPRNHPHLNVNTMLRSFLLITARILWRNKVTSFVNIFSLCVGMTAFIFIMLYVHHETSYDKFHENYDRIYRLEADHWGYFPPSVGLHLKGKLPEIKNIAQLALQNKNHLTYTPGNDPGNRKDIEIYQYHADSTTFDVFTFPFSQGDPHTALRLPMSVVLTQSTAKKLFGNDDPMGKIVVQEGHEYTITGIMHDVRNSHMQIDALFSLTSFEKMFPGRDLNQTGGNSWAWSITYLLMEGDVDQKVMERKVSEVLAEINNGKFIDTDFHEFRVRPFGDLYFNGEIKRLQYERHGNFQAVMVLISIGVFLLLLAGINYINLTTARSATRAKELAVKRITGSSASLLRFQLIAESVIISLVSLVAALTIVQLGLPYFNRLTEVNIEIRELNRPEIWAMIFGGGVLIGILAGVYPAFYLTAVQPVKLIKGSAVRGSEGSFFRSMLMTFQFALSIVMVVAIIVNLRQLNYLRTASLGFNKEQVVMIFTPAEIPNESALREEFRKRLKTHPGIEGAVFSWGRPGAVIPDTPTLDINGVRTSCKLMGIEADYIETMGLEVVAGRAFSETTPGDRSRMVNAPALCGAILFNETAVAEFGLADPLGQLVYLGDSNRYAFEVIGVVKDFHFSSLHDKIAPMTFVWFGPGITANIRIAPSNILASIKAIETEFKSVWGASRPFQYEFLDESFNNHYRNDEQLAKVIGYFTVVAVIVACLGLFALSSFMVTRRTKEIGVRKAMGASGRSIYSMLSWDFLRWIIIAIVVACPIGWYLMNLWLETFAYHITISVDTFVLAALVSLIVAIGTVTWQCMRAANANPVDSLRYE